MPELPDLQVFARNLSKVFKGEKLEKVATSSKKLNVSLKDLSDALEGETLIKIDRVGKELHFTFQNGRVLGLHLMLHGQLFVFDKINDNKYTVIELLFENEKGLAMTDFQSAAAPTLDPKDTGVPDALDFELTYLKEKLAKTRTPIKTVLIDQKVLRGIGNAYADEILYDAKISPLSSSNKIPERNIKILADSIKLILENAEKQIIKAKPDIISGEIRDFLLVHRPNLKQTVKGETIHQQVISSRKTYYTDSQELFS